MKLLHVTALAVAFLIAGCASPDVNPRTAKPGIGYVDFYADDTSGLCWEIRQLETNDQVHGKILLQEFKRRTNDTIRLAVTPGSHRLQISFLNRVVMKPGIANVVVKEGQITPVRVTLVETGKALIETRQVRMGASYTRTGRSTKVRASAGATFRVEAETEEPIPYRPKESMAFGSVSEKTGS